MLRHPLILGVSVGIESADDDGYMALLRDGAEVDDRVLRLLGDVLDDAAVVLDVGANVGIHAIAAARIASRGRVTAFEPSPRTADYLVRNLERNQITAVDVRRVALGSKSGELTFFHNTEYAAGSLVIENSADLLRDNLGPGEVITVPVTTLDEVAADLDRLDLLKIDTEGHDPDVLRGGRATIARLRPVVLLEFSSYALTMHAETLPQTALAYIRDQFDEMYIVRDGYLEPLATDLQAVYFLYENATTNPVMDLVGVPEGARLGDRVEALRARKPPSQPVPDPRDVALDELRRQIDQLTAATSASAARAAEIEQERDLALSELAAMRATLSWRVTRPIRWARGLRLRRKPV